MAKFKARARTLDMLGRQQIAGIPTALHELFKNAYDAYAEHVEVDFFRKSNILVLRDDGTGMSRKDFESRWLTLGTESKLQYAGNKTPEVPTGANVRPVMGEKGIGRLAIASIGPIVMVATRSEMTPNEVTIAFVPWRVFELPSIDLGDFEVPVETFSDEKGIDDDVVEYMRTLSLENIDALEGRVPEEARLSIREEIDSFDVPLPRLLKLDDGPTVMNGQTGTIFIIAPVSENLRSDIDDENDDGATSLQRMLLGFSNTMAPKGEPEIKTSFRDHLEDGASYDRIRDEIFFTPEEFEMADHQVRGSFDRKGNFKGTVEVYDALPVEVSFNLYRTGKDRACGPFDFDFAYLQGVQRSSSLSATLWEPLRNKLNSIGGIYIYRNGIRVLPYGNVENDFLSIERRRNKGSGYYFFSYRRIFGAVSLTTTDNSALQEKAGREGFQNNKAYREFRDQLIELFLHLAEAFFRTDGAYSEEFLSRRNALDAEHKKSERRAKLVSVKRKAFQEELLKVSARIEAAEFSHTFAEVANSVPERLAAITESSVENKAEAIIELEGTLSREIDEAKSSFVVGRPKAVGLTKAIAPVWDRYQRNMSGKVEAAYVHSREEIDRAIADLAAKARVQLDATMRLEAAVDGAVEDTKKTVNSNISTTRTAMSATQEFVTAEISRARKILHEMRTSVNDAILRFNDAGDEANFSEVRSVLENSIRDQAAELETNLQTIRTRLERVTRRDADADLDSDEAISAMETELQVMREEYGQAVELAQLGMAVSIVQHEFGANVREVRRSLKAMRKWAMQNNRMYELYSNIRDGFDHLDNYLSLFTPLDRRLRRRKTEITGVSIKEFVDNLFGERFERHDVKFTATPEALSASVDSYASVILPVFVNLVDNSIHWLSRKDGLRTIELHYTPRGFELTDNGPGVLDRDKDIIFDFNFSTKDGGRGMGLYIAQTSLQREGFDIYLDHNYDEGARFVVETSTEEVEA